MFRAAFQSEAPKAPSFKMQIFMKLFCFTAQPKVDGFMLTMTYFEAFKMTHHKLRSIHIWHQGSLVKIGQLFLLLFWIWLRRFTHHTCFRAVLLPEMAKEYKRDLHCVRCCQLCASDAWRSDLFCCWKWSFCEPCCQCLHTPWHQMWIDLSLGHFKGHAKSLKISHSKLKHINIWIGSKTCPKIDHSFICLKHRSEVKPTVN